MAKVYVLGEHTFTQRDDGLYMCDIPFTMTEEECDSWRREDSNDGCQLVTIEENDLYVPLAVYKPGEVQRDVYDRYLDSIGKECECCIMVANRIPDNFLGGFLNGL